MKEKERKRERKNIRKGGRREGRSEWLGGGGCGVRPNIREKSTKKNSAEE